jgi:hypothetical protein
VSPYQSEAVILYRGDNMWNTICRTTDRAIAEERFAKGIWRTFQGDNSVLSSLAKPSFARRDRSMIAMTKVSIWRRAFGCDCCRALQPDQHRRIQQAPSESA